MRLTHPHVRTDLRFHDGHGCASSQLRDGVPTSITNGTVKPRSISDTDFTMEAHSAERSSGASKRSSSCLCAMILTPDHLASANARRAISPAILSMIVLLTSASVICTSEFHAVHPTALACGPFGSNPRHPWNHLVLPIAVDIFPSRQMMCLQSETSFLISGYVSCQR